MKAMDQVLILWGDNEELQGWQALVADAGVPFLWCRSLITIDSKTALHPSVVSADREVIPLQLSVTTSLTKILKVIASDKGIPVQDVGGIFSEAERTVLEEVLDVMHAPFAFVENFE